MTSGLLAQTSPRKVDIIWNVTLVCPWNCAICCVDAVHVTKRSNIITMKSRALTATEHLPMTDQGNHFEQAMRKRQQEGLELDKAGKMRVLDHLTNAALLPKIDFSGGDVMVARENFEVLQAAASRFGRTQITLTATGAGLAGYDVASLAPYIGELNFTYDSPVIDGGPTRPTGYANGNLRKAAQFAQAGVRTRGECPLSIDNIADETLRQIYRNLHDAGIGKLLLMRLFPVGRGQHQPGAIPSPEQYRRAIAVLREMEADLGSPAVKLQCALKFFDRQDMTVNPCDLLHESFGLQADGTLLFSPWAVGPQGRPLSEEWVIGNLSEHPLAELLASEKAQAYRQRLDQNFGHCKIFSYFQSTKSDPVDRIFDAADPLGLLAVTK